MTRVPLVRAAAGGVLALAACGSEPASRDAAPPPADAAPPALDGGGGGPFTLTSTAFVDGGTLPSDYTCDNGGHSPPLAWTGAPAGTAELALLMTTMAPDGLKWNWVLHTIPGGTTGLAMDTRGVGVAGLTSDGPNLAYAPPCSQGPGAKYYTFTLYALSAHPSLPAVPNQVTGAVVTSAIAGITLGKASATVHYTRP